MALISGVAPAIFLLVNPVENSDRWLVVLVARNGKRANKNAKQMADLGAVAPLFINQPLWPCPTSVDVGQGYKASIPAVNLLVEIPPKI